jgi:DedD protein
LAARRGEQFVVPAGAYTDPAGVIEKLKAAKVPYYTEPIATKGGTVIRVRAGPFTSRDAADKAQKLLRQLGLNPGNVASRS